MTGLKQPNIQGRKIVVTKKTGSKQPYKNDVKVTTLKFQKRPSTLGRLRKWDPQKRDSLKGLGEPVKQGSISTAWEEATDSIWHELQSPPQPRFNNTKCFTPMTVALSQSALVGLKKTLIYVTTSSVNQTSHVILRQRYVTALAAS